MADSSPQFRSGAQIGRWLALGLWLGLASLRAGDLPVFRCALEGWPARNYQIVIFHRGPLDTESQNLVTALKEGPLKWGANTVTSTSDVLEPMDESTSALWSAQTNVETPWMMVLAPPSEDVSEVVWAGRFNLDTVKTVLDSPARKKTIEALFRGDAAVWVLLECGDAMRDEAAVDTLAGTLKRLETNLQLSASMTSAPPAKPQWPMRVVFSLVRVTRNDPAEEFFVGLLSHGERFHRAKPAVFPVFGRGRALSALSGKHLDDDFIRDACAFITGACTNGVKDLKPGKDLLLCGRWDSIFEAAALTAAGPVTTNSPGASTRTAGAARSTGTQPSIEETLGQRPAGNLSRVAAVMIGLAAVAALVWRRIRRRP